MKKALTVALSMALLQGCSAIKQGQLYYTDVQPTAASVKAAGGSQVFNDSLYTNADFNADGSSRVMEQYDFTAESAPCTILGDDAAGGVYAVKLGDKTLNFTCRATNRSVAAPELRLYMVGSSADCASRSGNLATLTMTGVQQNLQCNGYRVNREKPTEIDLAYKG